MTARLTLHGTCVAVAGRGLVIMGPSGSGKSALALQMMALGAQLVADDRIDIVVENGVLVARCPVALRGLIEARGIGILNAAPLVQAEIHLVVDLGQTNTKRLPERHRTQFLGHRIDLVSGPFSAHLPSSLMLYLAQGRHA